MKFTVEVDLTTDGPRCSVADVGEAMRYELEGLMVEVEDTEYDLTVLQVTHHL